MTLGEKAFGSFCESLQGTVGLGTYMHCHIFSVSLVIGSHIAFSNIWATVLLVCSAFGTNIITSFVVALDEWRGREKVSEFFWILLSTKKMKCYICLPHVSISNQYNIYIVISFPFFFLSYGCRFFREANQLLMPTTCPPPH